MNNDENVVSLLKPIANTLWLPVKHMKKNNNVQVLK